MKKPLFLILICLLIYPAPSQAQTWRDISVEMPQTVLDEYVNIPYISFTSSRGSSWLAGNPNQLFLVLPEKIIDLTADLKDFGFTGIRQVATDGSSWLILGDAHVWQSKPDIAMLYDGKYFTNISNIIHYIPGDEQITQITGKQGLWYIITDKNIYLWHQALTSPAKINLPAPFKEPRLSAVKLHPVKNGWIAEFDQKNGPKSLKSGQDILDKRLFYFDGNRFQELTSLFHNISNYSSIGTNGSQILVIGADLNGNSFKNKAFLSDGITVYDVSNTFSEILPTTINPESQDFLTQTQIVWSGNSWNFLNTNRKIAIWQPGTQAKYAPDTSDNFLSAGYGSNGLMLFSGYKIKNREIIPRLVLMSI